MSNSSTTNQKNSSFSDNKKKETKKTLPERVAQAYYKHGLFLSTYPTCATSIAIVAILLCCYPLVNIPLPGTIPTKLILPYKENTVQNELNADDDGHTNNNNDKINNINNIFSINNFTFEPPYPWARYDPYIYVQQIILRSAVAPWSEDMILTDAYRAPFYEAFNLVEFIRNHEEEENKRTLGHVCLHVENVKRAGSKELLFPEYNCLVLSPSNFWQQNLQNFNKDVNILNTIFRHQNLQKTKVSIAEMLLGMKIRDSGLKRYPIRIRPRVIQFAVTLVLRENDKFYLSSLKQKLIEKYALHQSTHESGEKTDNPSSSSSSPPFTSSAMYIFYPGEFNLMELIPLSIAFVSLFMYVYFSLRKIDVIRSRVFLAISSVITVLGSLVMSLGFCFFFGLTISMQFKGIYPYLVIIVGLENVLVITKSVVSIDETLDLKIRIAKGLSKEGWSITKNLLTEITILTIGLATFVPVIQEFCIFAIVGLISDFFLQMIFFSTILALDIKKPEFSVEVKNMPPKPASHHQQNGHVMRTKNLIKYPQSSSTQSSPTSGGGGGGMNRSRSHPKLSNLEFQHSNIRTNVVVASPAISSSDKKIPKRLRLFNFWARTRFFQRAFMIWMLAWISTIIYNTGFIEHFFEFEKLNHTSDKAAFDDKRPNMAVNIPNGMDTNSNLPNIDMNYDMRVKKDTINKMSQESYLNFTEQISKLKYTEYDTTHHLSTFHWASILKQYNISLSGKYVTILPSIKLSHIIPPEVAISLRNPNEVTQPQNFQWKALVSALDPIDFNDVDYQDLSFSTPGSTPLYPKSPMEIFLILILCCISGFFLTYLLVVLYRCICSQNYAEWRASWSQKEEDNKPRTQQVLACVTLQVKGHMHSIDCMAVDGTMVASTCLDGRIKIWDSTNGELIADIARNQHWSFDAKDKKPPPIWCLDYLDNLIVIGCGDGRLEFWEGTTKKFKCVYKSDSTVNDGVTHVKLVADKVVAARLSGRVDILRLGTYNRGIPIDYNFSSVYRRTHVRAGSTGSLGMMHSTNSSASTTEELKCFLECQHEGHQQPITCLEISDGIVLTGSQDHTIKVFKLESSALMYTLHGHYGPITCLFIDTWQRGTGGSGSEDGMLYIWDLITGAGVYKIEAHNGPIASVVCAPSYIISLGSDGRLCVWERFQLNLLNTIIIAHTYTNLLMLTSSLLVRAKPGALIVVDVRTGETAGEAELDDSNLHICPKIMLSANDTVVCDYGNQLRIVRFPLITSDKCE